MWRFIQRLITLNFRIREAFLSFRYAAQAHLVHHMWAPLLMSDQWAWKRQGHGKPSERIAPSLIPCFQIYVDEMNHDFGRNMSILWVDLDQGTFHQICGRRCSRKGEEFIHLKASHTSVKGFIHMLKLSLKVRVKFELICHRLETKDFVSQVPSLSLSAASVTFLHRYSACQWCQVGTLFVKPDWCLIWSSVVMQWLYWRTKFFSSSQVWSISGAPSLV